MARYTKNIQNGDRDSTADELTGEYKMSKLKPSLNVGFHEVDDPADNQASNPNTLRTEPKQFMASAEFFQLLNSSHFLELFNKLARVVQTQFPVFSNSQLDLKHFWIKKQAG